MALTAPPRVSATGGSAATQAADADACRWTPKRGVSLAIRGVAFAVPFVLSALVARSLRVALPDAHGLLAVGLRWSVVIIGSSAVLVTADRVTRHLLPVAALFQVALVFPDRAPSRYKVALRSGSSTALAKRLREGGDLGDTPAEAAENALVLLRDLGAHDRLTRGHSERVRAYAEIIAEEMELPAADREKLRWAALIHDVGKLAVAPEILSKDGRPTDDEWRELRRHPEAGRRMLEPLVPWLGEWLGAATEHHERYDGRGYPRGLRGAQISLAGRIVAVADAYDCMTSARSYKKALPPTQARYELSRNAGSQFDPEVVRAFLNVSVGRLHLAGGPLAWLSSVPGVRDVATGLSGAAATASGAVAATGLAVAAVAASQSPIVPTEPVAPTTPVYVEAPVSRTAAARGTASSSSVPSSGADGTGASKDGSTPKAPAKQGDDRDDDTAAKRSTTTTTTTTGGRGGGSVPTSTTPVTRPPATTVPRTTQPPTTHAPKPPPTEPPSGQAPIANGETVRVRGGRRVEVDVLKNDSDPDGDLDKKSLRIVSAPAGGKTEIHKDKEIRYDAPEVSTAQQVEVRYRICDKAGHCSEAVLQITIRP